MGKLLLAGGLSCR